MTTTIETEGNTVEEAVSAALDELGADRSGVKIEVVKEESKGFLGIGAGKARVRVSVVENVVDRRGPEKTISIIKEIIENLGIEGNVESVESEDVIEIDISGPDLGLLIGKHGETLNAIQTIANIVAKKEGVEKKVAIDVEHYRKRRVEGLMEMAKQSAERAIRMGRDVLLSPMSSYDRRIVHLVLSDIDGVYTESEGEDPDRQVRIIPKR